jgi:hypothetical protein
VWSIPAVVGRVHLRWGAGTLAEGGGQNARFAEAKIESGNRAILNIQDLWLCVPASRQVCPYQRPYRLLAQEDEDHLDELTSQV